MEGRQTKVALQGDNFFHMFRVFQEGTPPPRPGGDGKAICKFPYTIDELHPLCVCCIQTFHRFGISKESLLSEACFYNRSKIPLVPRMHCKKYNTQNVNKNYRSIHLTLQLEILLNLEHRQKTMFPK